MPGGRRMTATIRHLCYQKRHWGVGANRELRNYWYCVIEIPRRTVHRIIHEWVSDVPAPKPVNAKAALMQLKMLEKYRAISENDPLEKRLRILAGLFDCVEQPTADGFRKQLKIVQEYYAGPSC